MGKERESMVGYILACNETVLRIVLFIIQSTKMVSNNKMSTTCGRVY